MSPFKNFSFRPFNLKKENLKKTIFGGLKPSKAFGQKSLIGATALLCSFKNLELFQTKKTWIVSKKKKKNKVSNFFLFSFSQVPKKVETHFGFFLKYRSRKWRVNKCYSWIFAKKAKKVVIAICCNEVVPFGRFQRFCGKKIVTLFP